jgi:undecaprenyl-diphosphatase
LTSFPSGHAQVVFTVATALTILFPRWGAPLFVSAAVISSSRIILASHYLSDVIAGAAVGILCTMAVKHYFDRKQIEISSHYNSRENNTDEIIREDIHER